MIDFTAYVCPQPQGSAKAFVIGGKARITSDNAKLKPFRSEITRCALMASIGQRCITGELGPVFHKHVPVRLELTYTFRRPDSIPKKRTHVVVKPDLDKLVRATGDALTGVIYHDDAQVVEILCRKLYGPVESVRVVASEVSGIEVRGV